MQGKKQYLVEKIYVSIRPLWMLIRKLSPKGGYLQLGEYWIKEPDMPKIDRLFSRTRKKVDKLDYEENTISAMKKYVKPGDRVTIVGGGYGVTGIVAMESGGKVTIIEASKERARTIGENWKHYNLKGSIIHGYVGTPISVWGELEGAKKIVDIPDCDILELDCEGAEKEVLASLKISPGVIIVESHGHLGSSSASVKNQLKNLGYRVTDEMIEELSNDVMVIIGERNGS